MHEFVEKYNMTESVEEESLIRAFQEVEIDDEKNDYYTYKTLFLESI